jgi:hypothetical protein
VTREAAVESLNGAGEIDYDAVDDIFVAFGFASETPAWHTEVYFHPRWLQCGAFSARDDGHHVLTALQRELVRAMLRCVQAMEAMTSQKPKGSK